MKDEDKTKEQLIAELKDLRQKLSHDEPPSNAIDKSVHEALLNEKTLSDKALNSLPGIFYLIDDQGAMLRWNDRIEEVTGYSKKEIFWMSPLDFFDEDEKQIAGKAIQEVFEKGYSSVEANIKTKSGAKIPYFFTGSRVIWEQKPCLVGMGVNIAERKRIEEALRSSENRLKKAEKMGHTGYWDWSPVTGELVWTDEVYRILGFAPKQITPSYELFLDMVHPEDREFLNKSVDEALNEKKPYRLDCRIISKEGKERTVYVEGEVKFDEKGNPLQMQGIFQDITERKQIENAWQESEKKYRTLIETASDAIFVADAETGILEDVNQKAEELIGREKDEIIGMHQTQLHPKDMAAHYSKLFKAHLHAEKSISEDIFIVHKNGSKIPVDIRSSITTIKGRKKIQGIFRDVTEQKQLQHQLIQAEKLSSIGTFVSGVAHELNNPLTGVLGYSENLLDLPNLPEEAREDLEKIITQSERAAKIVKNLLKFSREQKMGKTVVEINQILENTLSLQEYHFRTGNIEIVRDFGENLRSVLAESNQLQQVFLNILMNAYQSMVQAKVSGEIRVSSRSMGNEVIVAIENDGPPIPHDKIDEIFNPFYTTKGIGEGTGLGLYVSCGIVKDHGGKIKAENIDNIGVRFIIHLPITAGTVKEKKEEKTTSTLQVNTKVLVVDDEEVIRNWLERLLTMKDLKVLLAANGLEGQKLLEKEEVDIILSDARMPDYSGLKLAQWIKDNSPEQLKKFVFLTGAMDSDISNFCKANHCSYLLKPLEGKTILETIHAIVQQNK